MPATGAHIEGRIRLKTTSIVAAEQKKTVETFRPSGLGMGKGGPPGDKGGEGGEKKGKYGERPPQGE